MGVRSTSPIWLTAHPVQIWRDILDGYFSPRNPDGSIPKAMTYDSGAFAALLSGSDLGGLPPRYQIDKEWTAADFIEKCICEPYSLSYGMIVVASGSTSMSALHPFHISMPSSSLIIPSMSIDDIATTSTPVWQSFAPYSSMTMTYYIDTPTIPSRSQYVAKFK